MPEGPEVSIIREGLSKLLEGSIITKFEITEKSRYHKKHPDGYNNFNEKLPLIVKEIASKGKLIYFEFVDSSNNSIFLLNTLGLSGGWFHTPKKNSGIKITYMSPANSSTTNTQPQETEIWFDDQRHFATFKFIDNISDIQDALRKLGPDMMFGIAKKHGQFSNNNNINPEITPELFINRLRKYGTKNNKNITELLMEQKVISGIGNYLKCEGLYNSRISPWAKINNLTDENLMVLYNSLRANITRSYKVGGASIRHYSDINDVKGEFEYDMQVYGKKNCPNGSTIKHEDTPDKRTTYWCPSIQIIGV